jgi:hypothetical protein
MFVTAHEAHLVHLVHLVRWDQEAQGAALVAPRAYLVCLVCLAHPGWGSPVAHEPVVAQAPVAHLAHLGPLVYLARSDQARQAEVFPASVAAANRAAYSSRSFLMCQAHRDLRSPILQRQYH